MGYNWISLLILSAWFVSTPSMILGFCGDDIYKKRMDSIALHALMPSGGSIVFSDMETAKKRPKTVKVSGRFETRLLYLPVLRQITDTVCLHYTEVEVEMQ